METTEICRLTREAVADLLSSRAAAEPESRARGQRRVARWPFPGTVELWIPDELEREWHTLATSVNLSADGIGVQCDQPIKPGTELDIAIHEPEMSFHGRAVVRHCSAGQRDYNVGLQFLFNAE